MNRLKPVRERRIILRGSLPTYMRSEESLTRRLRFGVFEVDLHARELYRLGRKIKLQDQPFQLLALLLEHPGQVVTREELRSRIWPGDTFVDFDQGLNKAILKIRAALADHADKPRFVETLPRRGYRFIHPVNGDNASGIVRTLTDDIPPKDGTILGDQSPTTGLISQQPRKGVRRQPDLWLAGVVAIAVVLGVAIGSHLSRQRGRRETDFRIVPFTRSPGGKGQPAFSPDGKEIAYSWRGEKDEASNIYVSLLGSAPPLRLTTNSSDECSPAWSPDRRSVAFLRDDGFYLVSALGGPERKLADAYSAFCRGILFGRLLDWSPDGRSLAVADRLSPQDAHPSLLRISTEDGQRTAVVSQPAGFVACPAFSPDGKTIAFAAGAGPWGQELWVVPATGGGAKQLTFDRAGIGGLSWTADGSEIVFSSDRGGGLGGLWKIRLSGGTPEPLTTVGADSFVEPSVAREGNRLAYLRFKMNLNIWRTAGPSAKQHSGTPAPVIVGSAASGDLSFAPDGRKLAFGSDRTGVNEIWIANSDGTRQIQLTSMGRAAGTPGWSPDGQEIAFDCELEGHEDVFVIGANGGSPRRLTKEPFQNGLPNWSHDGRWIYFSSNRTGRFEVWKVPASGGVAVQVTKNGGEHSREAPDGKDLFYWRDDSLWKMPVEGGEETPVVRIGPCQYCWKVITGGVCFVDSCAIPYRVKFLDFKNNRVKDISALDVGLQNPLLPEWGAFDVSPDGKWILYGRREMTESDIMLLEGFH